MNMKKAVFTIFVLLVASFISSSSIERFFQEKK